MRDNLILTIYDSVLKNEPITKIHKKLYDMTINKSPLLFDLSVRMAKKAVKVGISHKEEDEKASFLFLLIWKSNYFDATNKAINKEIAKHEEKDKNIFVKSLVGSEDIFYVASAHDDCAEDHLPYQGKLYVDENWRNKVKNTKEVSDFIQRNHIKTIQWVTGEPVYFLTRPHCRHYFVRVSLNDALMGTFVVPHHTVGPRNGIQTKAKVNLTYYKRRLNMLNVLYKRKQTDDLKAKILKTNIIIKKWKNS